jgi:hypothetical protein
MATKQGGPLHCIRETAIGGEQTPAISMPCGTTILSELSFSLLPSYSELSLNIEHMANRVNTTREYALNPLYQASDLKLSAKQLKRFWF